MEYYKLLQLDREPFSNSPDPDSFFQSSQHLACLQKLELALRLKRGLNVVIGDVGTGKTTLCRQLIRKFADGHEFETHLILDPSFGTAHEFLTHIHELICAKQSPAGFSDLQLKERIKRSLFQKGVAQEQTLVLIIDEGQKITPACMEILREFLNFETNTNKLLQIVIFAQLELQQLLDAHPNFADRINLWHHLRPMNFKDTRQMVHYRLKSACTSLQRPQRLFTFPAMWAIYRASKGYPRKIVHLCHQSLLAMIIQNRSRAGWRLIRSCKKRIGTPLFPVHKPWYPALLVAVGVAIIVGVPIKFLKPKPDISARDHTQVQTAVFPVPDQHDPIADTPAERINHSSPGLDSPSPASESLEEADRKENSVFTTTPPPVATAVASTPRDNNPRPLGLGDGDNTAAMESAAAEPPQLLGEVVIKPGDTLMGLVQTVYGAGRNSLLRAVIEANPHIPNPNTIDIGHVVFFPAIATGASTPNAPCWWIILDQTRILQKAMQNFAKLSRLSPAPLQIVPNWSPDTGLRFQIASKGYYASQDDALNVVRMLPGQMADRCAIISSWPRDTVFFASPTLGGLLGNAPHEEALK